MFARMWGRRAATRRVSRPRPAVPPFVVETLRAGGAGFIGLALLVMMGVAWLVPVDGGLLEFTEPEIQFLFVAPISRRQLLVHRLLRSQVGLLFASIVPAMFLPSGSGPLRAKVALSTWLILVTMKVHYTGITL